MSRRITSCAVLSKPVEAKEIGDVHTWLAGIADTHKLTYLLAHSDEGVIWGRMSGKTLLTSHEVASGHPVARKVCPPLHTDTLQQARLFSQEAELLLWRSDTGWCARLIRDAKEDETPLWTEAFDEPQVLWGTSPEPLKDDFMLWTEGAQGLRHALPLTDIYIRKTTRDVAGQEQERQEPRPPRLRIRHYLGPEDTARIAASRLVGFDSKWEKQS
ncbi:MAG: TIGR03984 family CRISPR-associated protein [Anaerolineales bacterium]|nr:TIGR03984 family CRISPR-associated protein [Anaerolineales bacterium]